MISNCKVIELSEVITDIAAGPFGSNLKVSCFVSEGFPIIDGANLKGFTLTDNITKFVTEEKARSLPRSIAKRGDVVVTISGTIGQISYIPDNSKYEEYLCSQRQFRVSFNQECVYVPYLVFYFHTYEGQNKILAFANQVGVPALSQPLKNFKKIKMNLPSLDEQKRIAGIIETLSSKIELNNQINENLQQQAQAIFKAWFVDFEPFDGIMPENWRIGTISDLGNVVGGSTPSKAKPEYYTEKGIAWITPKDLSRDHSMFIYHGEIDITEEGLKNSSASIMPRGTVLFSSRAPIGYIAIAGGEVTTNQGFKSVVPFDHIGTAYVYYCLKHNLPTIEGMASGSTFKEVSGAVMKSVPVVVPDEESLSKFSGFCNPLFEEQEGLERQNKLLYETRDELLDKLLHTK